MPPGMLVLRNKAHSRERLMKIVIHEDRAAIAIRHWPY